MNRSYYGGTQLALFVVLACLGWLVYGARIQSGDTLQLFDEADSLARYGDTGRDLSAWFQPPRDFEPSALYPLGESAFIEEFPILIIAGWYQLVKLLPGVGYVHGTWALNLFMTALTGVLVCQVVVLAGFQRRTAVVLAVLYMVATIALPYSKTLFREAPTSLALMIACWGAMHVRARRWWGFVLVIAGLAGGLAIKTSTILAIPAVLMMIMPWPANWSWQWLKMASIGLMSTIWLGLVAVTYWPAFWQGMAGVAGPVLAGFNAQGQFVPVALQSYLFSPGGSLWGTSPVLLLAIPGLVLMARRGDWRWPWVIVVLVLAYAGGHALITGVHWFGGLSWPPRFLVPVVPIVMVGCAPVFDALWHRLTVRSLLPIMVLIGYSIWVQFNAVSLPWSHYPDLLPEEAQGLIEWGGGLNVLAYLRWVILPQSWASLGLDIAWLRAGIGGWVVGFIGLAIAALWLVVHPRSGRWPALAGLLLVLMSYGALVNLYETDPQYLIDKTALRTTVNRIYEQGQPGEPLIVLDHLHAQYLMNYQPGDYPRPITLPPQPGERASDRDLPSATGNNPASLMYFASVRAIDSLAGQHQRLWLLANNGPFTPWAVRPVEHYLAQNYYPEQMLTSEDPTVRALSFFMVPAPTSYARRLPDAPTTLTYGGQLALVGYTLPTGTIYRPGETIPISLYWRALADISTDYVIAIFLATEQLAPPLVQGLDSPPVAGFAPTAGWMTGHESWDQRTLRIPESAPPGDYRIWVVVYDAMASDQRLLVTGRDVLDDTIGILPASLRLEPGA